MFVDLKPNNNVIIQIKIGSKPKNDSLKMNDSKYVYKKVFKKFSLIRMFNINKDILR